MKHNVVALLKGYSVFIAASLTSLIMLLVDHSANIALVVWPGLILASVVTTMSAKSFRFVLAIALAVPSAVAFGLQNVGWAVMSGQMEISAVEDFVLVLIMTLPYCLALCVLGGITGMAAHQLLGKQILAKLKPAWNKPVNHVREVKLLTKY